LVKHFGHEVSDVTKVGRAVHGIAYDAVNYRGQVYVAHHAIDKVGA
jgi:hypothetical protein